MNLRSLFFLSLVGLGPTAHGLSFMKCNTLEGRTLFTSFRTRLTSGTTQPVYLPSDVVIFSSPNELQERIGNPNRAKIDVSAGQFIMEFESVGKIEKLHLLAERTKGPNAFTGVWFFAQDDRPVAQKAFCSIF